MINLANQLDRQQIIREIESPENKQRKAESLKAYEIFSDRIHQYVLEYLRGQFKEDTVRQMPVVSSINLARRIAKQEASIYKMAPERQFAFVTPEIEASLKEFYSWGINEKFSQANEFFKLMNQVHIQWVLKDGHVQPRVLLGHHLDVIPNPEDPEKGLVYIISTFDKREFLFEETTSPTGYRGRSGYYGLSSDGVNQAIAERDDYRSKLKQYVVWSKDFNFIMNASGDVISGPEIENPLGIIPIVDVAISKDFEYWVRQGLSLSDFTVQFNGSLSDVANVVRLQGWGQAVFKGPENLLPESLVIGPNHVLRLPIDPNNPVDTEFSYTSANPDIQGTLNWIKAQLTMFMSSRGVDVDSISFDGGGKTFSSGIERLLAMIQKFEASKSDMDLFKKMEMQSFDILKAYGQVYSGTDLGEHVVEIPENAELVLSFKEPQMITTEKEKLDLIAQKLEQGLVSRVRAYMELYGVPEDQAVKEIAEINGETQGA